MSPLDNSPEFDNRLFFSHLAILCTGFLAGMVATYIFTGTHFDFSHELVQARELGIVSRTILAGYAKKQDIIYYAAMMGFPTFFALGSWIIWVRCGNRQGELALMFSLDMTPATKTSGWRWILALVVCTGIILTFNINNFYVPYYNSYTGAWPFLAEEGENLAWVQSILNGGVYGKDFHCLYGPMLIYPLAWLMKLCGTTVVTARVYTYCLDLLAYAIVITFLYKVLRTKTVFAIASVGYFLIFGEHTLAPNITYLRVALGLVPIMLTCCYQENKSTLALAAAGVVLGQSCLFSQEVGICSAVTVVFLLAAMPRAERKIGMFCRDMTILWAWGGISMLPILIYFASKGALSAFFNGLLVHPRLIGLGYGALPFPPFREFFHAPLTGGALTHYWVIFVYIVSAIYLFPLLILRRRDNETLLRAALLVFGAILFRAALGRSDQSHVFFTSPPAFLLMFIFLDSALAGLKRHIDLFVTAVRLTAIIVIIGALFLLSSYSEQNSLWSAAMMQLQEFTTKFALLRTGVPLHQAPRAGIYFDVLTAESTTKIGYFLDQNTRPGDYVYFFPNEAAYYFLFNRNNPTRYVISYFAATREQRLELVADLEKKRPQYVVYSPKTWRIDEIPEYIQVPEVCDYLSKKYHSIIESDDVVILKRNAT